MPFAWSIRGTSIAADPAKQNTSPRQSVQLPVRNSNKKKLE